MLKQFLKFSFLILLCCPFAAYAAQDFQSWLAGVREEALQKGISQNTVNTALNGVTPIHRVIELDRKQPEGRLTFAEYKAKVISKDRIAQGRRLLKEHAALLDKVSAQYGVQPQYIVALWGIETSYGNNTGGFSVIQALATLAHDGRRSEFFRSELLNALKIIDAGHISAASMKGSWAGAMGQNQFMPSSFHAYAVDGNHDGMRDIWNSLPDVFASTANYLSRSGWRGDERWGRAVKLPQSFPESLTGLENKKPLSAWHNMGVMLPNGELIPVAEGISASIILPDGINGPAFLAYDNFRVTMKWNKSIYFATSVGLLADAIAQ